MLLLLQRSLPPLALLQLLLWGLLPELMKIILCARTSGRRDTQGASTTPIPGLRRNLQRIDLGIPEREGGTPGLRSSGGWTVVGWIVLWIWKISRHRGMG